MADYIVELNTSTNTYEINTGGQIAANSYEDFFQLAGNQTSFTLTHAPITNTLQLFINGLLQTRNNFNLSGNSVNITGFTPTTDDLVIFNYLY